MYDGMKFGGIENMTKRLTMTLVALALFVILAILPVSAGANAKNGTIIGTGAQVYIGEEGLNLTHALYDQGRSTCWDCPPAAGESTIGWWASAADISSTSPSKKIDLATRYWNFQVAPADFVGYTGNWYLLESGGTQPIIGGPPYDAFFTVLDPSLNIIVWDFGQITDVTGKSVPQGTKLGFRIDTNLAGATDATRTSGPPWNKHRGNVITAYNVANAPVETLVATNMYTDVTGVYTAGGTVYTNYTTTGWAFTWGIWGINQGAGTIQSRTYYKNATNNWFDYAVSGAGDLPAGSLYAQGTGGAFDPAFVSVYTHASPYLDAYVNATTDGFITIKVKPESGTTLQKLYNASATSADAGPNTLLYQYVNTQPFFWGSDTAGPNYFRWATDALDTTGQYAYPAGTYTITAESLLNKMKDNYKNAGADYTGKTVTEAKTITLVSDTVKIVANKDSVVRSKPFSVTVTGRPSTDYYVWVKNTRSMTGGYDDQPPMMTLFQEKVYNDSVESGTRPNGQYTPENKNYLVWQDVAPYDYNGTKYYARITTSTSGTRTIEFETTNWTKAQTYTIRVEQRFPIGSAPTIGEVKSDEVDVKVEKGAVTITAAGDQSYYLGEEIKFSGTNTESYWTYLFIIGPNLPENGADIKSDDPRNHAVVDTAEGTFKKLSVMSDNTWSWKWGTSTVALDAGTYTIYAVAAPRDKVPAHISRTAYGTVSIIIKKPFVSATASQSTVAKGDKVFITGIAEGKPGPGVAIWILGKNKVIYATESVNADASFSYEVTQDTTRSLASGQYFLVVQHPMQNDQFDVVRDVEAAPSTNVWVKNLMLNPLPPAPQTGTRIFKIEGASSLQGTDAAEALVQGINDPNVDDTYTKLAFLVEEPVIRIDAIGDRHVGDKFTITATTNLAVDDAVLFEVYSSSFKPTQKSQSGEFSGATGTVKVTKGDAGLNKLSFDVDASTFKPDEYIVKADAVIQEATGTALFNVLEGAAPIAVPTAVKTAAPTGVAPTAAPTAAATPTKTPTQPGFGALVALIGLGAVAFLVVRKH
jgi:PGF-CTERM protein